MCLHVVFLGTSTLPRLEAGVRAYLVETNGPQHRLRYYTRAVTRSLPLADSCHRHYEN
jgi:hypothetical protein